MGSFLNSKNKKVGFCLFPQREREREREGGIKTKWCESEREKDAKKTCGFLDTVTRGASLCVCVSYKLPDGRAACSCTDAMLCAGGGVHDCTTARGVSNKVFQISCSYLYDTCIKK